MSDLVRELMMAVGTEECIAALEPAPVVDPRDIAGDYDGMSFREEDNAYLRFIGQAGC